MAPDCRVSCSSGEDIALAQGHRVRERLVQADVDVIMVEARPIFVREAEHAVADVRRPFFTRSACCRTVVDEAVKIIDAAAVLPRVVMYHAVAVEILRTIVPSALAQNDWHELPCLNKLLRIVDCFTAIMRR